MYTLNERVPLSVFKLPDSWSIENMHYSAQWISKTVHDELYVNLMFWDISLMNAEFAVTQKISL